MTRYNNDTYWNKRPKQRDSSASKTISEIIDMIKSKEYDKLKELVSSKGPLKINNTKLRNIYEIINKGKDDSIFGGIAKAKILYLLARSDKNKNLVGIFNKILSKETGTYEDIKEFMEAYVCYNKAFGEK